MGNKSSVGTDRPKRLCRPSAAVYSVKDDNKRLGWIRQPNAKKGNFASGKRLSILSILWLVRQQLMPLPQAAHHIPRERGIQTRRLVEQEQECFLLCESRKVASLVLVIDIRKCLKGEWCVRLVVDGKDGAENGSVWMGVEFMAQSDWNCSARTLNVLCGELENKHRSLVGSLHETDDICIA